MSCVGMDFRTLGVHSGAAHTGKAAAAESAAAGERRERE